MQFAVKLVRHNDWRLTACAHSKSILTAIIHSEACSAAKSCVSGDGLQRALLIQPFLGVIDMDMYMTKGRQQQMRFNCVECRMQP